MKKLILLKDHLRLKHGFLMQTLCTHECDMLLAREDHGEETHVLFAFRTNDKSFWPISCCMPFLQANFAGQARVFLLNLLNYPELCNARSHLIIRRRDKVSGLDCCCMSEVHMRRRTADEIPEKMFAIVTVKGIIFCLFNAC